MDFVSILINTRDKELLAYGRLFEKSREVCNRSIGKK